MNSYQHVPQQLKDLPNWVCWKLEKRDGRLTKVPYNATSGQKAKANTSSTWTTFNKAVAAAEDCLNDYEGIGFELHDTGLVGIDFDGAIHDGVVEPYVLEILKHLGDPYTEISPSGSGLHAFVECSTLPAGGRKLSKDHNGIEIYSGSEGGRYFTVTGNRFACDGIPKIDDIGLAYLLITQARNAKFKSLWLGDTAAHGDDHSSADYALMCELAKLTNKDVAKMEKYFGASALARRDKWRDREGYRHSTIRAALKGKESSSNSDVNQNSDNEPAIVSGMSRNAASIKPVRLRWFWDKRIPLGKITLFAGNPDNGKSLAANSVAAICTTGRAFPDSPNMLPPSDVLMMLGEDDVEDTAIPRLMAADADLAKVHFLEGVLRGNKEGDVRLDVDLHVVESKFKEFPNARLLIVDPISNFLGDTNMFGEQDVRTRVLVPLKQLAAKYGVAVVLIMHLNKKSDLDAIARVGGAMAFIGVARCSWVFVRDEAGEDGLLPDSFTMSRIKNNLTAPSHGGLAYKTTFKEHVFQDEDGWVGAACIEWGSVVQKSADQALGTSRHEVGRPKGSEDKKQDAVRFLEDALSDGRRKAAELYDEAHHVHSIKKRTLERAKDDMHLHVYREGKAWYWELAPMNETTQTVTATAEDSEPILASVEAQ
jgi:primase-polymerase (primpol)-like protein